MDGLHSWLAKYLAPDPAPSADNGSNSANGITTTLESIHSWAAAYLAPDATAAANARL